MDGRRSDVVSTVLEHRRQRRQRSGSEQASFRGGGDCPAVIVGGVEVRIEVRVVCSHGFFLSGMLPAPRRKIVRARPVAEPGRARSHFAPARRRNDCETMNSGGTLRPRALARISICFTERIASAMMSSRRSPRLCSAAIAVGSSSRQWRSARPAESVVTGYLIAVLERALGLIVQRRARCP